MSQLNRRELMTLAAGLAASKIVAADEPRPTGIVRLSVLRDVVFAPTEIGNLVTTDYDKTKDMGRLGQLDFPTLALPGSTFRNYVEQSIHQRTTQLKESPIVVMVHGFLADPRETIDADATQMSNNPHDFSYHYSSKPGPYWRHTASWPLGLGFRKNDAGASGLAVAFGWNSTPDLLTQGFTSALSSIRERLSFAELLPLTADLLELAQTTPKIIEAAQAIPVPINVDRVQKGVEKLDELLTAVEEPLAKLGDRLPDIYREPYQRADEAAWVLVNTLRSIAIALPNRPIDLFCHSLGSRVVVQALYQLAKQAQKQESGELKTLLERIGRVILVGGAEYTTPTLEMLRQVQKVRPEGPSFYNFMARRDRILSLLAQRFHPVNLKLRRVIGQSGLTPDKPKPNWIDLQLDTEPDGSNPLNVWLKPGGMSVSGAHLTGVLNHWHYFTSPENMELFRAIVRDRAAWDISTLRRNHIPNARVPHGPRNNTNLIRSYAVAR